MSELTREQIESSRSWWQAKIDSGKYAVSEEIEFWRSEVALCDMALASLRPVRESAAPQSYPLPKNRSEFFTLMWNLWNTYAPQYCGTDVVALERVATALLALERRESAAPQDEPVSAGESKGGNKWDS